MTTRPDRRTLRVRPGRMAPQPRQPHPKQAARSRLLGKLLEHHGERLLRQAQRHSELAEDAEDALANACVAYLRAFDGGATVSDSLHWMLVTIRHCAWEISRRRRRRERLHPSVPLEFGVDPIASGPGPLESAERTAATRRVKEAIGCLPADDRDALVLFGLGYSHAEIAELRGWSRAKVHRRLAEGRSRLRRILEREAQGGSNL